MLIVVNGREQEIEDGTRLGELLQALRLDLSCYAVEVNRDIVPRSLHGERALSAGDRVEIVTPLGGG